VVHSTNDQTPAAARDPLAVGRALWSFSSVRNCGLEHDQEKWIPIFRPIMRQMKDWTMIRCSLIGSWSNRAIDGIEGRRRTTRAPGLGMPRVDILSAAFAAALLVGSAALSSLSASESSTELPIGGLSFTPSDDVTMESEDLTITPDHVIAKYRLLNHGAAPVTLTIGFPLPDIDLSDSDTNYSIPANDPVNFVGFQTKINKAPIKYEVHQRALLAGKDVTAAVHAAGLALLPIGEHHAALTALAAEARDKLVKAGLLVPAGTDQDGNTIYNGSWVVKTTVSRKETFPPSKPTMIEHHYRTSVGLSLDTVLRKAVRQTATMEPEFQRYKADYCIPDELLKGIDRLAGTTDVNVAKLQERRINYTLKTSGTWAAPIKDFRLVVDKGRADRMVSFCGEGVKKISPTAFELKAKDFTPAQDLKILLISKGETTEAKKLPRVDTPVPPSVIVERPPH
jgi:hypothetical protein